jgi:pilus assembly protein CpaB
MWKVKRMNTARIVVLTIAVGAGGVAAYPANGQPLPDTGLGRTVVPEDLQRQAWPTATISNGFIRENERPDAATRIAGLAAVVRHGVAGSMTIQKRPKGLPT